jgi:hypothetical protein
MSYDVTLFSSRSTAPRTSLSTAPTDSSAGAMSSGEARSKVHAWTGCSPAIVAAAVPQRCSSRPVITTAWPRAA